MGKEQPSKVDEVLNTTTERVIPTKECVIAVLTDDQLKDTKEAASATTFTSSQQTFETTNVRWYILFIFSLYAAQQYFMWNTFGPISASVKKAFLWNNGDIAMLANWDTILYVILSMQLFWLLQKIGMRKCFIGSLTFVAVGSGVRCFTTADKYTLITMNIGQVLNGLGGMLAQSAGAIISNTWFPPNERTTATAISSLSCPLGLALSYIICPLVVPDLPLNGHQNGSQFDIFDADPLHHQEVHVRSVMKLEIQHLMFGEMGLAAVTLMVALLFFPDKPKQPPSHSASIPKLNFQTSFKMLLKRKDFWLILFVASSVTGVYSGWGAVLTVNLQDHGLPLTQTECGLIGFGSTIFSVFGGVAVGRLSDKYSGHIKLILLVLYTTATVMFVWFILICINIIPFNKASIYTTCLIGGFCINGSVPLLYELIIELTYPVTEGVSIGLASLINNIFTFAFLALLKIPKLGVSWMNWCLAAVCGLSIILLVFFNEKYERKNVDDAAVTRETIHNPNVV